MTDIHEYPKYLPSHDVVVASKGEHCALLAGTAEVVEVQSAEGPLKSVKVNSIPHKSEHDRILAAEEKRLEAERLAKEPKPDQAEAPLPEPEPEPAEPKPAKKQHAPTKRKK
jgi:hypothetical protein